jgi:2-oxoisovalerate dehydrogenase E1 component beta subunit
MAKVTMIEAINRAHAWEMAHDPNVVVLGEDVGINGGVFRATAGLQEKFGKDRVQDTPLAEGMIAGMSIGMAAQGLRPIAEIQFMGFIYPAMDQIANHMARHAASDAWAHHLPARHAHAARRRHSRAGASLRKPGGDARASCRVCASCAPPPRRAPTASCWPPSATRIRSFSWSPSRLYRLVRQEIADDGQALPLDVCYRLREGT